MIIIGDPVSAIAAACRQQPDLAWYGFGGAPGSREPFGWHRASMRDPLAVEQFLRAVQWLHQARRTRSIRRQYTSYDWKHVAERWHRRMAPGISYIAEGMFIAAAVQLGFIMQRERSGRSVWLNIAAAASDF